MKTVKKVPKGWEVIEEALASPNLAVITDYGVLPRIEKLPGVWIKEVASNLDLSVDYGIFEQPFPEHCYQSTTISLCVTRGQCEVNYDYGRSVWLEVGSTLTIPSGIYFLIKPSPRVEMFIACTPAWDGADVVNWP